MSTTQRPPFWEVVGVLALAAIAVAVFWLAGQAESGRPAQGGPTANAVGDESYPGLAAPAATASPLAPYPAPPTPVAIIVSPKPAATDDPLRATATAAFAAGVTYDLLNRFSIRLLAGWHAILPRAEASKGMATFQNYGPDELEQLSSLPPDLTFIRVTSHEVITGSSFELWLAEQRERQISSEYGVPTGTTLSENESVVLGRYSGTSYYVYVPDDEVWQLIFIRASENRIISISINPIDSPEADAARLEAMQMLDTLEVLP